MDISNTILIDDKGHRYDIGGEAYMYNKLIIAPAIVDSYFDVYTLDTMENNLGLLATTLNIPEKFILSEIDRLGIKRSVYYTGTNKSEKMTECNYVRCKDVEEATSFIDEALKLKK